LSSSLWLVAAPKFCVLIFPFKQKADPTDIDILHILLMRADELIHLQPVFLLSVFPNCILSSISTLYIVIFILHFC
jgi:hypothetical protein